MVKLNRIYTKTGDAGTTGLATGARVPKDHLRVETYGTVDESNAAIGLAIVHAHSGGPGQDHIKTQLAEILALIQHDLFDCGADLATPVESTETPGSRLRILPSQTERLERLIDEYNEPLAPLTSFVLPGGSALAASLHLARTIVRRAERLVTTLRRTDPDTTNAEALKYLNRLSDLLFVLSRVANDNGAADTLWTPGASRPK
jgi:cob(I)alamin adenosyltransferase